MDNAFPPNTSASSDQNMSLSHSNPVKIGFSSFYELIGLTLKNLKTNTNLKIQAIIAYVILILVGQTALSYLPQPSLVGGVTTNWWAYLAYAVFIILVILGDLWLIAFLAQSDSDVIATLKHSLKRFPAYLGLQFLLIILSVLSFALFIFPAFILIVPLSLLNYYFILGSKSIGETFKFSFQSAKRFYWSIFYRLISWASTFGLIYLAINFILTFGSQVFQNNQIVTGILLILKTILIGVYLWFNREFFIVLWREINHLSQSPEATDLTSQGGKVGVIVLQILATIVTFIGLTLIIFAALSFIQSVR